MLLVKMEEKLWDAGEIVFPATSVPTRPKGFVIAIQRAALPAGFVGTLFIEGSTDRGETWQHVTCCTFHGGVAINRAGQVDPETTAMLIFAEDEPEFTADHMVRGRVELAQPALCSPELRTID